MALYQFTQNHPREKAYSSLDFAYYNLIPNSCFSIPSPDYSIVLFGEFTG
jgi:hypothetical protein